MLVVLPRPLYPLLAAEAAFRKATSDRPGKIHSLL